MFWQACNDRISKARVALTSALSTCKNANVYSWDARIKLFDSIVVNCLLYAAPIWSLCYLDDIEIIQSSFLKRSLCLPISTTNYVLRCETGRVPLKCFVFNNLMVFWLKILKLSKNRLVRICYDRLKYFHRPDSSDARYNWCTLVSHLLEDVGYSYVWTEENLETQLTLLENNLEDICIAYRNKCRDFDVSSLITSTSNPFYFLTWSKWRTAKYLRFHMPFSLKSLVAQVRLSSRKLYFKGKSLQFGTDYCIFCNRLCEMSSEHVLLRCRAFADQRVKCSLLSAHSLSHLLCSISSAEENAIKSLCYFIIHVLKCDDGQS